MLYNFNKLGKDRLFKGVVLINLPGGRGIGRPLRCWMRSGVGIFDGYYVLQLIDPGFNFFDRFTGFLLKPAEEFVFLSFFVKEVVVCQVAILLLDLSL